jgi:flagellin
VPNAIGGISVVNNQLANTALLNVDRNQQSIKELVNQLSTGLRVNSATDDPSGLVIATGLQNQAVGFDTANLNVQDATNAANVADGALSTITSILQRIRSLATEAANTITSFTDRQALQAEVAQLLQEINGIATGTSFNGQALLDGTHAGFQAFKPFSATVTSNGALGTYNTALGTSELIAGYSVSAMSSLPDLSIELQVVQINANQQGVLESYHVYGTGLYGSIQIPIGATVLTAPGLTISINASFGAADVGTTAFVKLLQYVSASSNANAPAFQFQSGANEGATMAVGLPSVSTSSLRISNINVASVSLVSGNPSSAAAVLGAQDAIGQIDQAITQVNGARAVLGSIMVRLQNASTNNAITSVNLTAAESAIRNLNVGNATVEYNKAQILGQIGTSVVAQSNTNAQSVLGLFR